MSSLADLLKKPPKERKQKWMTPRLKAKREQQRREQERLEELWREAQAESVKGP